MLTDMTVIKKNIASYVFNIQNVLSKLETKRKKAHLHPQRTDVVKEEEYKGHVFQFVYETS